MNNSNPVLKQAEAIHNEIIELRRTLHSQPELGFEEYRTSAFIADYLNKLGLKVITGIAKTGVIAVLKGELPGSTIALRADIDALPVQEEYDSAFKSQINGRMHACGHDAHTAILLGTAKLLAINKNKLKGTVKFIFQPAEENVSGAKAMINEGVLQNPDVDIALALHILPDIKSGHIEIKDGIILSSMDEFMINILGKGGHGSNPQNTIDPIVTGSQLVTALQTIVSRRISPSQPAVVSICQFLSGTKSNIIPSTAYLSGTIRCQDEEVRKNIFKEMDVVTKGVCASFGADYELKINDQLPAALNDRCIFNDFVNCTSEILEKHEVEFLEKPRTYSDDFALFGKKVPSLYFLVGTYNEKKDCIHPPHSSKYKIDEDIFPLGVALFTNYCMNRCL